MALVRIAAVGEIPEGSAVHVETESGAVAVCNVAGRLHAIDGICPHSGGPLGHGMLHGTMLVCPYHAWEFDCVTGVCDMDEEVKQATYPVKIENGTIWVDVDENSR